jgi:peptide chain release factor 1
MEESMRARLETVKKRFAELENELADPALNNDIPRLTALSKERASLEDENNQYIHYLKLESDLKDAIEIINSSDPEMVEMMKEERKKIETEMSELEATLKEELIPVDPNDKKNIIVEIRGAVGGDEANIFAGDLLRMYTKYAESQGWQIQYVDGEEGAAGGYSYVSFMVKGENVYSKLNSRAAPTGFSGCRRPKRPAAFTPRPRRFS